MIERTIANVEADLGQLQRTFEEMERRLTHLTVENRLATESEIAEALHLTDSLPILEEHIRALRAELSAMRGAREEDG